MHVCMCVCNIYVYAYIDKYIYVFIWSERERERDLRIYKDLAYAVIKAGKSKISSVGRWAQDLGELIMQMKFKSFAK